MDKRLALVVDDSRTARESLKRMLSTHNLEVDTLESAPEALEYLKKATPDVIFMDHMMPDMDGFQALEAIKGNPDTAMIPIMMYTSKGGDLYVSQARALGAMGILPKQVQHAELFEVLSKLGLVEERRSKPHRSDQTVLLDPPNEVALSGTSEDIAEIASRAAQSLHGHSGTPGGMTAGHYHEIRQDLRELRGALAQLEAGSRAASTGLLQPLLIVLAMLVPLLWIFNSGTETRHELAAAQERIAGLIAAGEQQASSAGSTSAALLKQLADRDSYMRVQAWRFYDSIAWALNQGDGYPPEEEPFGDRRLVQVQELVTRLQALGFAGMIVLESHLGEFCLSGDELNGFAQAAPDLPVTDCSLVGHPLRQLPGVGERQSIAFANFLATSPLLADGSIRIELESRHDSQPRIPYPPLQDNITAGHWNRIAMANNRVEVQLVPEGDR